MRPLLPLLTAALLAPSGVAAQRRFEVTPWVGGYLSVGDLYDGDLNVAFVGGSESFSVNLSQDNAVMVGVRAGFRVGSRLSTEASVGYARSDARFVIRDFILDPATQEPIGDAVTSDRGTVLMAGLRLLIGLDRSTTSLILGATMVKHGGRFWRVASLDDGTLTNFGPVLGLEFRARGLPIAIRIEGSLYEFDPDELDNRVAGYFPGRYQKDFVISAGIPLGR